MCAQAFGIQLNMTMLICDGHPARSPALYHWTILCLTPNLMNGSLPPLIHTPSWRGI